MIKELMHDPIFLAGKSELATKEDLPVALEKAGLVEYVLDGKTKFPKRVF